MHLVGFIIRIHHDARSRERKKKYVRSRDRYKDFRVRWY